RGVLQHAGVEDLAARELSVLVVGHHVDLAVAVGVLLDARELLGVVVVARRLDATVAVVVLFLAREPAVLVVADAVAEAGAGGVAPDPHQLAVAIALPGVDLTVAVRVDAAPLHLALLERGPGVDLAVVVAVLLDRDHLVGGGVVDQGAVRATVEVLVEDLA